MDIEEGFKEFVKHKEVRGDHQMVCVKGFFSVFGLDMGRVDQEARHYFVQYWYDGEYDDLIGKVGYK